MKQIEQIAKVVKSLEREDGRLLPSDVVEAARDPRSVLHSHFEWDDSKAAHEHRLAQARALIRTIKVEVTVRSVPLSVVGYVRDPSAETKESGYRNIFSVRSDDDAARAAIVDEMKRVASAARRARMVAAVLGVEADIDQISEIASRVSSSATSHHKAS